MRGKSIYADLYIQYSHRAARTPRVGRPWRPRVIAWAGPTAFMRDRFYEMDSWYKARIHKPELLPELHIIDPDLINYTLADRLRVVKNRKIDIGFKRVFKKSEKSVYDEETFEKLSRKNLLKINVEEDFFDNLELLEHYHIFEDMFSPGVYFYNTQKFNVLFEASTDAEENACGPNDPSTLPPSSAVHFGNVLSGMHQQPTVAIERLLDWTKTGESAANFSTLITLNLDGDAFTDYSLDEHGVELRRCQLIHWLAGNIPDSRPSNEICSFETVVPYLQPLPFYGTGYHRVVFLLFRHRERIDFNAYFGNSSFEKNIDGLLARRFDINDFVKRFEDMLTPSAVKFCQVKWDESCDAVLHKMGLKSPRYWYDWNEPLKPEQKEFPIKPMSFHHYLNMYRPAEKVRREVARQRLELLMNQEESKEEKLEKPEYPDMFYQENSKNMPSWVHREHVRRNTGWGPYTTLYDEYVNPAEQHTMRMPTDKTGDAKQKVAH